jgi:hypothetical protein
MISEELKNLVARFGTLILIENNRPKFVVMSYDAVKGMVIHKSVDNSGNFDKYNNETPSVSNNSIQRDEEIIDRLNREISALKDQVAERERELSGNL